MDRDPQEDPHHGAVQVAARSPTYDLHQSAVSLWLNSGMPVAEAAHRAGRGIAVLLKISTHCIDRRTDTANKRITDALGSPGRTARTGDDDNEQAS